MTIINNINDSRIDYYKSLRYTPQSHTQDKVFIAEGDKVTLKVLQSKLEIISIFAVEDFYKEYNELIISKDIPDEFQFTAEKKLMEEIVGYNLHSGIMAIARQPVPVSLSELESPIIILNGIINAENVGSIVRNSAAFGINSIIIDKYTSTPFLRRAARVSMGTVIDINFHFTDNLIATLNELKSIYSFKIISAEIDDKSIDINKFKFPDKFALILGNEGNGISNDLLEVSDYIVKIPITDNIPSLNVATTSGIFLYEISK